jgi:hypothetical protein
VPDGDIIEEEERFRARHDDVVRVHGHQVNPDGIVFPPCLGDQELGPDPVGG